MAEPTALKDTILWRKLDYPGHDACAVWASDADWRLTGTAAFLLDERPWLLTYSVDCDADWRTRVVSVTGWAGHDPVSIRIERLSGVRWSLNGSVQPQVEGCIDVDLSFTAATNLIPMRRLKLKIGDEADNPAAWLRLPDLTLVRLGQHYRRVGQGTYEYQAPTVGYSALLKINESGLVEYYPDICEMETGKSSD